MDGLDRRRWMAAVGLAAVGPTFFSSAKLFGEATKTGGFRPYELPKLPYPYDALAPHIDERTLRIHHDKHHAGYVRGLNATLAKLEEARRAKDFSAIRALSRTLAFCGSGHVLHTLYFGNLASKSRAPKGKLLAAIDASFGSFDAMMAQLMSAAKTVSGSGWGMLAYEPMSGRLLTLQIEKHENQMFCGCAPLLVIDVWEHAYYLQYQNRRGAYLEAVAEIINWPEVERRFAAAQGGAAL